MTGMTCSNTDARLYVLQAVPHIGSFFHRHHNPPIWFNVAKLASLSPMARGATKVGHTAVKVVTFPFGMNKPASLAFTITPNEKVNAHNFSLGLKGTNRPELLQQTRLQGLIVP